MKKTGFIAESPSSTDYIAGGETGIAYEEITSEWGDYLPTEEKQRFDLIDTMACVSFSCLNTIESQVNVGYYKGWEYFNQCHRFCP